MSPPSRWSGLKFIYGHLPVIVHIVSTLAVEWIEISSGLSAVGYLVVSTLAVEWIEIDFMRLISRWHGVSTLAVEWIEIVVPSDRVTFTPSPPSRWSGLKSGREMVRRRGAGSPPSRWSGLKSVFPMSYSNIIIVSTLAVEWIEICRLMRYA